MMDYGRNIEALEQWRKEKDQVDIQTAIRIAVLENDMKDVKDSIKEIQGDTKWLRRTITSSLVVGGITLVIGIVTFLIQKGLH